MNYIKLFEEFSKKSITTEEFITKSKKIYGDKYDYSKTKFFYSKNSCTLKLDYDTYQYYGVKNLFTNIRLILIQLLNYFLN